MVITRCFSVQWSRIAPILWEGCEVTIQKTRDMALSSDVTPMTHSSFMTPLDAETLFLHIPSYLMFSCLWESEHELTREIFSSFVTKAVPEFFFFSQNEQRKQPSNFHSFTSPQTRL